MRIMMIFKLACLCLACGVAGCGRGAPENALRDGIEALRRNRFRTAVRILRSAAAQSPDDAAVLRHLAVAQWKTGALKEAVGTLRRACELAPNDREARVYLGLMLLEARHERDALTVLEQALETNPEDARVLTALAVAHWRAGDTDSAGALLTAAVESSPDYAPAAYNFGVYLRDKHDDHERAQTFFRRYLAARPDGARAAETRRALARAERAAARRNGDSPTAGPRSPFESASPQLIIRANAALQRGDIDEAYILLREAVQRDETDAHALWTMAGFVENHLGARERAALLWRDFHRRFPEDPRAGEALRRWRALSATGTEHAAEPNGTVAGQITAAQPLLNFNPQPRRDPEGARRAFARGAQFMADGDWDRAIFFFTHAIEQDDSMFMAFVHLGRAYANSGDLERALEAGEHALRWRPESTDIRLQQARLLIRKGAAARAMEELRRALAGEPDHPEANLLAGMLLRAQPDRQTAARLHFHRYLERAPDDELARRVRQWLEGTESDRDGISADR